MAKNVNDKIIKHTLNIPFYNTSNKLYVWEVIVTIWTLKIEKTSLKIFSNSKIS